MNVDLRNRLALVFGAGGPVCAAIEQALAQNGATVLRIDALEKLETALAGRGDLHLLVNVGSGAEKLPEADEISASETQDFGSLTRALVKRLERVVNVFSAAAFVPIKNLAGFSAAQAGLMALTRAQAMEFGPDLRVNAVAVGPFEAGAGNGTARLVGHTALRRPAALSEICAAVLFLADPANTYMTGHTLNVDGGWAVGYARNF